MTPRRLVPLVALTLVSAAWLGWNLGGRYLWQDEAACAVLARRMLEHGRPLAYDGTNLITMDEYRPTRPADEIALHSRDAASAVAYFARNGDFRADTTWIGQPWGQFVLAGVSLALLGETTVAARLPFVATGVATVLVVFALARQRFGARVALTAAALLLGNVFWYLHARQCRYYAPATLMCLTTLATYLRWRDGRRLGALAFASAAWVWFQFDFGSPWPVLAVLGADGVWRSWRARGAAPGAAAREPSLRATLAGLAALAAALAPFVVLYDLGARYKPTFYPLEHKLWATFFNVNQFQLPLALLPLAGLLAWRARRPGEARVVVLAALVVLAQALWMACVGPFAYYRYVVDCTPLACLVVAWTLVRGAELLLPRASDAARAALAAGLAAAQLVTPLLALPFTELVPAAYRTTTLHPGRVFRHELRALPHQLANLVTDPNRATVEHLRARLRPSDEVLVNYEDIPLMFYLDVPVRGGIPAFRVADPAAPPPRFVVWRDRVPFVYSRLFQDQIERQRWRRTVLDAPSVPWGNTPDPNGYDFTFWRGPDAALAGVAVYELVGR
jgi:4-amino-4-deoxy-L-arabinose transferase-like glycosyltransferase